MAREQIARLRRLALEGDPVALVDWLAQLARRDSMLEADLTPRQARKLAGDSVEAGVGMASLRVALDLAHSHSIAFASIAAQLRDSIVEHSGFRWHKFSGGFVWHGVLVGEMETVCGYALQTYPRGYGPPDFLTRRPEGKKPCERCMRALPRIVAVTGFELDQIIGDQ